MDNDDGMSINNSGQPSNSLVNQPAREVAEKKKVTDWRSLGVFSIVVFVVILLIGIVYLRLSYPQSVTPTPPSSASPAISPTSSLTTVEEFPPLYPHVQWESTESGRLIFRTPRNELVELEGYRIESVLLKTYPQDLIDYYKQEVIRRGWTETEVASGPNGESYGYNKDSQYIRFGLSLVGGTPPQYHVFVESN